MMAFDFEIIGYVMINSLRYFHFNFQITFSSPKYKISQIFSVDHSYR